MPHPLIIIGASARAAAQSAIRAGLTPHCIDLFADRDLARIAHVVRCPPSLYPHGIPSILFNPLNEFPEAPVLLTGSMENHLETVEFIARRLPMFGPSVASMRRARDPFKVNRLLLANPVPGIVPVPAHKSFPADAPGEYFRKPYHSSAGHAVTLVSSPVAPDPSFYFQPFVRGAPISALFHSGHLLGATHQIIGAPAFGATHATQYVGNVAPLRLLPEHQVALARLGKLLSLHLGLSGIFGVDFILDSDSALHPLEINPRYTASLELLERAHRAAYLTYKPNASPEGSLSDSRSSKPIQTPPPDPGPSPLPIQAKAILYAIRESVVPDLFSLFPESAVADVPPVAECVPTGRPVCTLLTSANTPSECMAHLHEMATYLYTRL